jgi:hypothetical protein
MASFDNLEILGMLHNLKEAFCIKQPTLKLVSVIQHFCQRDLGFLMTLSWGWGQGKEGVVVRAI